MLTFASLIKKVKGLLPSARLASLGSLEQVGNALEFALVNHLRDGGFPPLTPLKREEVPKFDLPSVLSFPPDMDRVVEGTRNIEQMKNEEQGSSPVRWLQWTESLSLYKNPGLFKKGGVIKPLTFSSVETTEGIPKAKSIEITPLTNDDNATRLFASFESCKQKGDKQEEDSAEGGII
jgi:hypothetical protein